MTHQKKVVALLKLPGWTVVKLAIETESKGRSVRRWRAGGNPQHLIVRGIIDKLYNKHVLGKVVKNENNK